MWVKSNHKCGKLVFSIIYRGKGLNVGVQSIASSTKNFEKITLCVPSLLHLKLNTLMSLKRYLNSTLFFFFITKRNINKKEKDGRKRKTKELTLHEEGSHSVCHE